MKRYSNMTTPELIQRVLLKDPRQVHPAHRIALIRVLAERLEREYQRANHHRDKSTDMLSHLVHLEHCANTNRPGPGYIKVAKPHIQQVFTRPGNKGMWRCTGSFGTVQYGDSPSKAYAAWRRVMERGHGIPRQLKNAMTGPPDWSSNQPPVKFRFNYMRKD